MSALLRYWNIWRIHPASEKMGYKCYPVSLAQQFIQKIANGDTQARLLSYFQAKGISKDNMHRAQAGLCLRCYVSEPILKACKKIDSMFAGEKNFTYHDFLGYVLNDDGETLVIPDRDGKTQLVVNKNGETKTTAYTFFSVKVLLSYAPNSQSKMSLDNWAYLQTKQHPELKKFLSEHGFQHLSDWALLNRTRAKQLEALSEHDRHLVEVFHGVYRRDRIKQQSKGARRCPDPTTAQLQEMLNCLQEQKVYIRSAVELLQQLKQVATQLRHYDIWSYREPLEIQDPDTGNYTPRADLPFESVDELDIEHQELLEFLREQFLLIIGETIEQEIQNRISSLQKSRKYALLAKQFIPGLQLYYCQGMSLKEIAPQLGMTSWDQARRVLNPGELLSKIRTVTVQKLLDSILEKAYEKGFTTIPPEPEYLRTILESIEAFVDDEAFREAAEEIRVGKNRSMISFYAQELRQALEKHLFLEVGENGKVED